MVNRLTFCTLYDIEKIAFYLNNKSVPYLMIKMNEGKVMSSHFINDVEIEVPDFIINNSISIYRGNTKNGNYGKDGIEYWVDLKSFKIKES